MASQIGHLTSKMHLFLLASFCFSVYVERSHSLCHKQSLLPQSSYHGFVAQHTSPCQDAKDLGTDIFKAVLAYLILLQEITVIRLIVEAVTALVKSG